MLEARIAFHRSDLQNHRLNIASVQRAENNNRIVPLTLKKIFLYICIKNINQNSSQKGMVMPMVMDKIMSKYK